MNGVFTAMWQGLFMYSGVQLTPSPNKITDISPFLQPLRRRVPFPSILKPLCDQRLHSVHIWRMLQVRLRLPYAIMMLTSCYINILGYLQWA